MAKHPGGSVEWTACPVLMWTATSPAWLRKQQPAAAKTDKKDAIKLANYGLDHWLALPRYIPEDEVRLMLKTTYRQYQQYAKVQTMLKNNLIFLLDTAFPDANRLFASPARADGSEKWVDFVTAFPHCKCVCGMSEKAFTAKSASCSPACFCRYRILLCVFRWQASQQYFTSFLVVVNAFLQFPKTHSRFLLSAASCR